MLINDPDESLQYCCHNVVLILKLSVMTKRNFGTRFSRLLYMLYRIAMYDVVTDHYAIVVRLTNIL